MIRVYVDELPEGYHSWDRTPDYYRTYHRKPMIGKFNPDEYVVEYECPNPMMNGKKEHYFELNQLDLLFPLELNKEGSKIVQIKMGIASGDTFRIEALSDYFTGVDDITEYISNLDLEMMDIHFRDDEMDCIFFDHIKKVSIDIINEKGLEPRKLERVKKWADEGSLLDPEDRMMLPCYTRITSPENNYTESYEIVDGRHRLEYAKELGMKKILARLGELIYADLGFRSCQLYKREL